MHLVLVGLSHHHAPIQVRERLSCPESAVGGALAALKARPGVREAALLFTCNRTEVYAAISRSHHEDGFEVLRRHLSAHHNVPESVFSPYLYYKTEQDAALHLVRVASGLDSLVLGEAQILGQVRNALRLAQHAGATGAMLNGLFQQAITCGKRVQTETTLRQGSLSIGAAAVDLASRIFDDLSRARVLVLGAGKMSELTARDLVASGVRFVMVANRTYEKAVELASRLGGQAIQYDSFLDTMTTADIVISSTSAPHPILRKDMLAQVMKKRRGRPLFLIDIAVPRDIEADVADLDNVFLYNIDDLQEVAAEGARGRAERAQVQAEAIASEEAARFLARMRLRAVTPVISDLKRRTDERLQHRIEILRGRLGPISDRDWQVLQTQMHSLVDEMMLEPILRLKREAEGAATSGVSPTYDLSTAARELFGLDEAEGARDESVVASAERPDVLRGSDPIMQKVAS